MNIKEFTPGIELHDQLNPLLWDGDHLKADVRLALQHIAHKFQLFLGIPVRVVDTVITGSQTAYTYTEESDLDLHLIVDYRSADCDQPVHELFDSKRQLWKQLHTIDIRGIPVECYVEDHMEPAEGHVYSLDQDRWIKQSRPVTPDEIPDQVVRDSAHWTRQIKTAVRSGNLAILHKTKQLLRDYRHRGLKDRGELSRENLVFKTLRNNGAISQLVTAIRRLEDRELSLA